MARLIPGKTKVQIELFNGVRLSDVLVGLTAFLMIVFIVISSLPFKFYFVLGVLFIAGLLLFRMDTVPNYVYLMNMLRHFAYRRTYRRAISDEQILNPDGSKSKSFAKVFQNEQELKESPKERKERIKKEDKILASKKVPEAEKEKIRQRRREEAKAAAKRAGLEKEQSGKAERMESLSAFTDIRDGYISYGGKYYGAVLEIPAVEFRFFSSYRRANTIENGLGKLLRTIHTTYGANIVKLERPMHYEAYLDRELQKLDQLRHSYEQGMLTEEELKIRVEVMYDRIANVENLCGEEKIVEPFYYIVLFDGDKRQLENQISSAIATLKSAEMRPKRLGDKELAVFLNSIEVCENQALEMCRMADHAFCVACTLRWLQQPAEE